MRQVDGAGRIALAGLVIFVGAALAAKFGVIAGEYEAAVGAEYMRPGDGAWLGTDALGRDLLARAIQGTRVSLAVGVMAACGMVAIGAGLGGVAGMRGGWADRTLIGVADAFAAVPPLVALLAVVMVAAPGLTTAALAIACTQWTAVFRSVRAEALRLRASDHDRASVAMGAGVLHRVRWHLLPQLRPVLVTAVVLGFVYAVKVEAVLAFFGASAPELPSWGRMLADSGSELARGIWWPTLAASVPLALLVLCAQVLADRLGDRA